LKALQIQLKGLIGKESFFHMQKFILEITRERKQKQVLQQITDCNERLSPLLEGSDRPYVRTNPLDFRKPTPPYQVRILLEKLYKILRDSWEKTCLNHAHKAKLRLAMFAGNDDDVSENTGPPECQDFDLLFSRHDTNEWKQSKVRVFHK
jgi:hypothetical protein